MPVAEALHARGSDAWLTPPEVFDPLHAEFHFEIGLAASPEHSRLPLYVSPEVNSLTLEWEYLAWCSNAGWCNPPYSDDAAFVRKAAEEARNGFTTVMLTFAKTDVVWWHDVVMKHATEVRLIKGRVNFIAGEDMYNKAGSMTCLKGERAGPAPKGSCILVLTPAGGPPRFSSLTLPR